jgi:beta-galactosidase/beta-glucuronidase
MLLQLLFGIQARAQVSGTVSSWNTPSMAGSVPIIDLCGTWNASAWAGPGLANSTAFNATVPGDIYTDLLRVGVIGDPLQAFGDWKTAWAGRTSWCYSRTFSLEASVLSAATEVLLVIEGVETNSSVTINGQHILATTNSWLTYALPITGMLTPGLNNISVIFRSVYDSCQFSDPMHANVTCPDRVYIRQAASSWGWDWANRYSPVGISRPIYLALIPAAKSAGSSTSSSAAGQGARVSPVVSVGVPAGESMQEYAGESMQENAGESMQQYAGERMQEYAGESMQEHAGESMPAGAAITAVGAIVRPTPGEAAAARAFIVEVVTTVYTRTARGEGALQLELRGEWVSGAELHAVPALKAGENTVRLEMSVARSDGVDLWWPAGYGTQRLYNVTVGLVDAASGERAGSVSRSLGFRTVRLQTDSGVAAAADGSTGSGNSSMILLVNGVRVLVRGSSLVPLETFNGRVTSTAAIRLLRSTVAANMNALRVWGGGNYLPPAFYDAADQAGVMLLHDFMLSWYPGNPYPAFSAFRDRLVAEVTQKVTRNCTPPPIRTAAFP